MKFDNFYHPHSKKTDSFPFLSLYGQPKPTFRPHLKIQLFDVPLSLILADGMLTLCILAKAKLDEKEYWRKERLLEVKHLLGYFNLLNRSCREMNTLREPIIERNYILN